LLALCDEVLREAGARVSDLAGIACGAGPGSFTGLRVGLAVAKGLALPTGLPLILVSSLDALACDLAKGGGPQSRCFLPCLDAGKGQVYARMYAGTATVPRALGEADWVLSPDDLVALLAETAIGGPMVAGGNGIDRYLEIFRTGLGHQAVLSPAPGPSATSVGLLGLGRLERGQVDDIETAVPRYGRPPDITRPKKALWVPQDGRGSGSDG
jgi:tRNA threonylcarbamoyladenosine biosynthesis protein TsaB